MEQEEDVEPLVCIERGAKCVGEVTMRHPGCGYKKYPRCQKHGDDRVNRQRIADQRYGGREPADFSPADAGESWEPDC